MTANPHQRSLFDLTVPAVGPRTMRSPKPAPVVRPGQKPVIAAQHKGEEETLDERFAKWIEANPAVIEVFIRRAKEYIAQGRKRIGAKRIAEEMRADEDLWTGGDPFKINNLFISRIVRRAIAVCPELAPYFELRELQS